MYTCGLTVYARGHIGNFRTFVALDVLRRVLQFEGYTVRQVRNYTDVDDRTIAGIGESRTAAAGVYAAVRRGLRTGRGGARARGRGGRARAPPITSTRWPT